MREVLIGAGLVMALGFYGVLSAVGTTQDRLVALQDEVAGLKSELAGVRSEIEGLQRERR